MLDHQCIIKRMGPKPCGTPQWILCNEDEQLFIDGVQINSFKPFLCYSSDSILVKFT